VSGRFDRIPIDASCSGTGTLAHNPEIKWRLRPGDLADLRKRQVVLLEQGRRALAPGGLLVYSTCSLATSRGGGCIPRCAWDLKKYAATQAAQVMEFHGILGRPEPVFYPRAA
jgi:16S rRNA (cytosine967-C5)-methyltransferase